jgi:hypothetical protein
VTGDEDTPVIQDLSVVFFDPDGDLMEYDVVQLGTLIDPTDSQIQNHELVQSFDFDFATGEMTITLQPDKHGSVTFNLEADDLDPLTPNAEHEFVLTVNSEADFPEANDNAYTVQRGSILQIVNVSEGLLGNDSDPDGDTITFNSVIDPPDRGVVQVNSNGTFIYTNDPILSVGQLTDSFTYNIVDSTNKLSNTATVTIAFAASAYQNPISGLANDVNADGFVTALDALRIINFLDVRGSANVSVSEIGTAPPDFLDTDGTGAVSPLDALLVLNELAELGGGSGEGEFAAQIPAALGVSSSFVAANRSGLPVRDMQLANDLELASPLDQLLTNGLDLNTAALESAVQGMEVTDSAEAVSADSVDEVLASVLDEIDIALTVE